MEGKKSTQSVKLAKYTGWDGLFLAGLESKVGRRRKKKKEERRRQELTGIEEDEKKTGLYGK